MEGNKMDFSQITDGTIFFLLIYFAIYLAIPIGIVVFIVKIISNQSKIKSDMELIKKRVSKLEKKSFKD